MSKAAARRRRQRRNAIRAQEWAVQGEVANSAPQVTQEPKLDTRPPAEQRARGFWAKPGGRGDGYWKNQASDMIGRLFAEGHLSHSQHDAARLFQEVRAAYVAELGTSGFGSCLADNQTGYDSGDGDPQVIAAYRRLEKLLGRIGTACLRLETQKGADDAPYDLNVLRNNLDRINRPVDGGRKIA